MPARRFNLGGTIDPAASPAARLPWLDAARGVAILAMVVYHFAWDLRYFGYITANVESDLGWQIFAHVIAGTFLFIVGVSLVLAQRSGFNLRRFLRRLGIIAAAAAAVTAATWYLFPDTYIFFGILHHIAVASVLGLAFVRAPITIVIGAAVISFALPLLGAGPAFDHPTLLWLGLSATFPRSNDFVPLFPWFGVVLAGIAAARLWPHLVLDGLRFPLPIGERSAERSGGRVRGASMALPPHPALSPMGRGTGRAFRPRAGSMLVWAGRWSLVIYLLHQPILFGLVSLAAEVAPPSLLAFEPDYLESCVASCIETDAEPESCRRICGCTAERSQAEGLWRDMMLQTLTMEQELRYFAVVDECRAAPVAQ